MNKFNLTKSLERVLRAEAILRKEILDLKKMIAEDQRLQFELSSFLEDLGESTRTIDKMDEKVLVYIRQKKEVTRKELTLRFVNDMKSLELQGRVLKLSKAQAITIEERQGKTKPTTVYRAT